MPDSEHGPTAQEPPPFTGAVRTQSAPEVQIVDSGPSRRQTGAHTASIGSCVIGVDVGGSGIKAAPVDVSTGALAADRVRIDTPSPATPDAVAATVAEVVGRVLSQCPPELVGDDAPVGLTMPGVVRSGVVLTAANIDPSWIGTDAAALYGEALDRPVAVLNDADAAGVAEVRFGAGRDVHGVMVLLTLGTGIGSALFTNGILVPNTELGHLPLHGDDAERYASSAVRKAEGLSMKKYAKRLQTYLELVERLLWPDLILIGGGISRRSDELLPHIELRTPVQPAQLRNEAGIVGAALLSAPH